ncbi:ATP-binding protein [Nocardia salmonicida]|uniref:ATP-binding protein n=1 Tax=Nocardia salmonicida TaxID=53431 RepID=UPI0033E54D1C
MDHKLEIRFHGRVIEHLGIDMYQSAVAAIAELVSNAWDADASNVDIILPDGPIVDGQIVVSDNGEGMTFEQCQERFLKVGYNRRSDRGTARTRTGRPVMGRKGIGKFAGFGIANLISIATVSKDTGERTVFELDVKRLTDPSSGYADNRPMLVDLVDYSPPNLSATSNHGTTITLSNLTIKKRPGVDGFRASMASRFLLLERSEEFKVMVNGTAIAESQGAERIEFDFPADYGEGERPTGLTLVDGWGEEMLPNGEPIRWRIYFYKKTISDELCGVSVFSHHKLAQKPFTFNLGNSLGGQHGISYMSGRVQADYIDNQGADLISTERQRINWDSPDAEPLEAWGRERIQSLLRIWKERRAQAKVDAMNSRIHPLSNRLDKLERHERRIVERALKSVAKIPVVSDEDFAELSGAMLTAWEGGRLRDLIDDLATSDDLDSDQLVEILIKSKTMSALHAAERVRAQLNLISGLEDRIRKRELENAVRDYIAENPWMISPEWDTFRVERQLTHIMEDVGRQSLDPSEDWKGRVDLALASGDQLLIVEFMRPGLTVDWDHVQRYRRYVQSLRGAIIPTDPTFRTIRGLLVADRLATPAGMREEIESLRKDMMEVTDWNGLLRKAKGMWSEYFDILVARAPDDARMAALSGDAVV